MEGLAIDKLYPVGRFDKFLMVRDGNREMYDLMGKYIYSPLYKMVQEADMSRLEKALADCVQEKCIDECIHLVNSRGEYEKYILSIRRDNGEDACYYIEFQNLSGIERQLDIMERRIRFLQNFLTGSGQFFFVYRIQDNHFYLFWMDYDQEIAVYGGDADDWAEKMKRDGLVEGQDKMIFDAFCSALRRAERGQSFTFRGKILTKGGNVDTYRIRILQENADDKEQVLGVWSIINEQTGNEINDYIEGTYMDSLTRILNKRAITEYAQAAVESGEAMSLVMMDVDNFKDINDTYGHMFGDQVIAAVAGVITRVIGDKGAAGRIGGDEFMIVLDGVTDELDLRNYLRGIKINVAALFQDRLGSNRISCSIGAARSGIDSGNYKDLFRIADKALYIAKQKGKNRFIIYKKEKHGQFNMTEGDYDMVEIRDSFYAERDLWHLNELLAELVLKGSSVLPRLLEHAVHTLMVSRMTVTWGEQRGVMGVYPEECREEAENLTVFECREYRELFREDMLTITNTNMLEFSMPEVYGFFQQNKVLSTMQHLLRDEEGRCCGMVTVEECVSLKHFPKLAVQLFENMCRIINAVLIREEKALDN